MKPGALRPRAHTATDTDNHGVGPGPKRPGRRLERIIAMIIRPHGSTQLLITQPDHAALAGRIMERWAADDFPASPRRPEILRAIAEHDNGWLDVDAAPLVDPATGNLLDFIHASDDVRQGVWPRGVDRLAQTPYAAALVAQHALEIYARYRPEALWRPFFAGMKAAREGHLRRASLSLDELQRDYLFVRAGDLISLTFCNAWQEEQTIDRRYRIRLDGDELLIAPDPFAGGIIPLEIAGAEMPKAAFWAAADTQETFQRARRVRLRGTLRGHAGKGA
jgi:hypothetical protein